MQTIALLNRKGGVGKSSTTLHLGGTLAKRGRRVLLVDNDAQASLTQAAWGSRALDDLDPDVTVAAAYAGAPLPDQIIHPWGLDRIWLIPGHQETEQFNLPITHERQDDLSRIKDVLRATNDDFDYCLIDCAPNLNVCSMSAMVAADWVVVPLQAEDFGSQGLSPVKRAVNHIGAARILGYLLTMFSPRLGVHQAYEQTLRETFGDLVLRTTIPISTAYKESVAARKPISHFSPRSSAAKVFDGLADEIESRIREAADVQNSAA